MATSPKERADLLSLWIKPSSEGEKVQQDRAETMVRKAIAASTKLSKTNHVIYTKGSYPNNTNVRIDSDVDVVVELRECSYYDYKVGVTPSVVAPSSYEGDWTPSLWRAQIKSALEAAFGSSSVDGTGKIAINVSAVVGSRPSTDIVPSFAYRRYDDSDRRTLREGSCVFPADGSGKIVNWPEQQLTNGRKLNTESGGRYKNYVRVLKNAENYMVSKGTMKELPSYLMECLVFNVPSTILTKGNLDDGFRATLVDLWTSLEAEDSKMKMVEPNWMKWLFGADKKWTLQDGKDLVLATWSFFGY